MNDHLTVDELLDFHAEYRSIYKKGLVGIGNDVIQIEMNLFKRFFKGDQIKTEVNGEYIQLTASKEGIKFVCLV